MEHKLQLTIRTDVDALGLGLQVSGCLTGAAYPVLLRALARAGQVSKGPLTLDLRGARHLDPDVLLHLRAFSGSATAPAPNNAEPGKELPGVFLKEPSELPVCLAHVAIDGAVLEHLTDAQGAHAAGCTVTHGPAGTELIDDLQLCQYYEGSLDPASTVRALSDEALGRLVDALYRHLDSPGPSFGARTWFELATDEMDRRDLPGSSLNESASDKGTVTARKLQLPSQTDEHREPVQL